MAKKGMARPDWTHTQPRNDVLPVPEIQGGAKHGKRAPAEPHHPDRREKPISGVYPAIDNDLARDNLENNIPAADLEDL